MSDLELREALAAELGAAAGRPVTAEELGAPRRLSAGANRRTLLLEQTPLGALVLQVERAGTGRGLPAALQTTLLRRAHAAGVAVPEVVAAGTAPDGPLAGDWTVTRHLPGESVPRVLLRTLDGDARAALLADVATAAAAIHTLDAEGLPPVTDPLEPLAGLLTALGRRDPVLTLGLRQLAATRPPAGPHGVVHGDLRLGNLLVQDGRLTAVLDWELATAGDVHADLGWLCSRTWRFGEEAEAAGLGTAEALLDAYGAAGGTAPSTAALRWWEAVAALRWGAMCLLMAADAARRSPPPLEPAMVGRRLAEAQHDLLRLLPGGVDGEAPAPGGAGVDEPGGDAGLLAEPGPADDLLAAVAQQLDGRAEDPDGSGRWGARVGANAVRTAARRWALDADRRAHHDERLDALGVEDDDALCTAIEDGRFDDDVTGLAVLLAADVREELAITNPTWATG